MNLSRKRRIDTQFTVDSHESTNANNMAPTHSNFQRKSRRRCDSDRYNPHRELSCGPPLQSTPSVCEAPAVSPATAPSVATTPMDVFALLNQDNAIRVMVNGRLQKFLDPQWLEGDGRASGSILSKLVLGTGTEDDGPEKWKTNSTLSRTTTTTARSTKELWVDEALVSSFDWLIVWLAIGDSYLQSSLTDENASHLFALASYYGLDQLERAIQEEQQRREALFLQGEQQQQRQQDYNKSFLRSTVASAVSGSGRHGQPVLTMKPDLQPPLSTSNESSTVVDPSSRNGLRTKCSNQGSWSSLEYYEDMEEDEDYSTALYCNGPMEEYNASGYRSSSSW